MSVLNCRTRESFVSNHDGAYVAMPGLYKLPSLKSGVLIWIWLLRKKWARLLLLAAAKAWFSFVDCYFWLACSVCQRLLLPTDVLEDFVFKVGRRVVPCPGIVFPLPPEYCMRFILCLQRGENETEGVVSDTHLSTLSPVKISKENNVSLGNSLVSPCPGVRVGRWQKGWTNWKERVGLEYGCRTRVSVVLQDCAGCEECWLWVWTSKWGWNHLLSCKYIARLKSLWHDLSVAVAGCGASAASLWLWITRS